MLKSLSKKQKKGVSAVVGTILLIALTMALVSVVWVVVNNLVRDKTSSAESCFGILDKVTINQRYTCYNNSDGGNEVHIAISVKDIDGLDDILVGISGSSSSASFKITESPAGLTYFDRTSPVDIPGKNSGKTYIYDLSGIMSTSPTYIEIAPIINGESCSSSSSIEQIDNCALLA